MDNLWLLVSYVALVVFNSIDSVLTRIAIKRGYRERNPYMRSFIEKYGLDRTILIKTLAIPLTGILMPIFWNFSIFTLELTIMFSILAIFLLLIDCNGLFQLLRRDPSGGPKVKTN